MNKDLNDRKWEIASDQLAVEVQVLTFEILRKMEKKELSTATQDAFTLYLCMLEAWGVKAHRDMDFANTFMYVTNYVLHMFRGQGSHFHWTSMKMALERVLQTFVVQVTMGDQHQS